MERKNLIKILSFILCIILFIAEIFYLFLRDINKIKKQEVINTINNLETKKVLNDLEINEIYNNNETINKIVNTETIDKYVKEKLINLYLYIRYNEEYTPIKTEELMEKVEQGIAELRNIEIEQKNLILSQTKEIGTIIEEKYNISENFKLDTKIYTEILIIIIIISVLIIIINKSYESFLWLGIPTLITGVLSIILFLSLTGTIDAIDINNFTYVIINKYLPSLLKNIKETGIIFLTIGIIEMSIYITLKYKRGTNGNNGLI